MHAPFHFYSRTGLFYKIYLDERARHRMALELAENRRRNELTKLHDLILDAQTGEERKKMTCFDRMSHFQRLNFNAASSWIAPKLWLPTA